MLSCWNGWGVSRQWPLAALRNFSKFLSEFSWSMKLVWMFRELLKLNSKVDENIIIYKWSQSTFGSIRLTNLTEFSLLGRDRSILGSSFGSWFFSVLAARDSGLFLLSLGTLAPDSKIYWKSSQQKIAKFSLLMPSPPWVILRRSTLSPPIRLISIGTRQFWLREILREF